MGRENLIDFNSYDVFEDGTIRSKHWNRFLIPSKTPDGYLRLNSIKCKDGKKRGFMLQRVIYYYFKGDIPDEMKVNHIDEDKLNNSITNLNLLTHLENCNWGTRNERISKAHKGRKNGSPSEETRKHMSEAQKKRFQREGEAEKRHKPVCQYNGDVLINVFKSVKEASEKTGFSKSSISAASRGVLNKKGNHKLGGYTFYSGVAI